MKLIFLLLISGACFGQTETITTYDVTQPNIIYSLKHDVDNKDSLGLDTIAVVLLVSDTSSKEYKDADKYQLSMTGVKYIKGYNVRQKYCCVQGETNGLAIYRPEPYYEHIMYLGANKKPLPKSYIVWQSK